MSSGFFYLDYLDRSISNGRGVCLFLLLLCFLEIPVLNANSADPYQTPPSAASDLGLHYLAKSFLWVARHNWLNTWFPSVKSPLLKGANIF